MTSLNPVMKIGNQITESIRQHLDVSRDYAAGLAEALLASVRIPEPKVRLGEYPHQLSGGMRQRVCIAVALACGPTLLFADEPTTALDVTVQAQVLDLIAKEQAERFMAMILVTHDLGVVAGRTEEIAVMYAGRIVEQAPTSVLFDHMKMPYTEALFASIPKLDQRSHTRLATIPGRPPDLVQPPRGCTFAPRCRYVQERCLDEEPPLQAGVESGHQYRCWFPIGTPEGKEALARNEREGRIPAAAVAAATAGGG
jgi:peptide/nickel transport system ATP-binding protein